MMPKGRAAALFAAGLAIAVMADLRAARADSPPAVEPEAAQTLKSALERIARAPSFTYRAEITNDTPLQPWRYWRAPQGHPRLRLLSPRSTSSILTPPLPFASAARHALSGNCPTRMRTAVTSSVTTVLPSPLQSPAHSQS